jgi:hypothetical protein
MINPDKNNKRTFRVMILVGMCAVAFAAWLMIHATATIK